MANHIRSLADLLQADAVQQLEVAYWDPQQLINLLSTGLKYTPSTSWPQVVHHPHVFTTTPMSPLPSTIPIVVVTEVHAATATSSSIEGTTPSSHEGQEMPSKYHWITPMLIPQQNMLHQYFPWVLCWVMP